MNYHHKANFLRQTVLAVAISTQATAGWADIRPLIDNEILTVQEAADLLRVSDAELKKMATSKDIPARRFGNDWRFSRSAVMAWLAGKDPVNAALLTTQQNAGNNSEPKSYEAQKLAQTDLAKTVAKGVETETPAKSATPETIGEKPKTKTAEEVFLRDQAVLLKPKQMTLELDLIYARNENRQLVSQFNPFVGSVEQDGLAKSDTYTSNFSVRYGLFDNVQLFSSVPLTHQSQFFSVGNQDLSRQASTRLGSVTTGLRYAALGENSSHPGVIFSIDGTFPTDDRAYGVGGSVALTKSYDPAVLFFNVGYRHFFNSQAFDPVRLVPSNQVNATAGIAYALNDTLTLSTSLSGVFQSQTELNGTRLPSREQYSLQFGVTSYLAKGLFIEPFVNFALNGTNSDVVIGTNLPYTFDL